MPPLIVPDFAPNNLLNAVAATWPPDDWPHWHKYADRHAVKLGLKDASRLPDAARLVIERMAQIEIQRADAFPDLDCHGAGMHSIAPGGFLARHLDGAVHPLTGWVRRWNAILFVDHWGPHEGGELEFFATETGPAIDRICPQRNTLVLFETSDTAWHQVAPVKGQKARRTLSLFWWSDHRGEPGLNKTRDRAQFAGY